MSTFLKKYGGAFTVPLPLVKAGATDFAASGDYTYAAGDIKIIKDGGAAANPTNSPSSAVVGNTTRWTLALTATEMQAGLVEIWIADATTKSIQDSVITIQTFGAGVGDLDLYEWADAKLRRGVSNIESVADADSEADAILSLLSSEYISSVLFRIYRSDGVTTHRDKTIVSAGSGNVITKVT